MKLFEKMEQYKQDSPSKRATFLVTQTQFTVKQPKKRK